MITESRTKNSFSNYLFRIINKIFNIKINSRKTIIFPVFILVLLLFSPACSEYVDRSRPEPIDLAQSIANTSVTDVETFSLSGKISLDFPIAEHFLRLPLLKLTRIEDIDYSLFTVSAQNQTTRANENGEFTLKNLAPGENIIIFARHENNFFHLETQLEREFFPHTRIQNILITPLTTIRSLIFQKALGLNFQLKLKTIESFPTLEDEVLNAFNNYYANKENSGSILDSQSFQEILSTVARKINESSEQSEIKNPQLANADMDFAGAWTTSAMDRLFIFERHANGGYQGQMLDPQFGGFIELGSIRYFINKVNCLAMPRFPAPGGELLFYFYDHKNATVTEPYSIFLPAALNLNRIQVNFPAKISTSNDPEHFTRWQASLSSPIATRTLQIVQNGVTFSGSIEDSVANHPFFQKQSITNGTILDGRAEAYIQPSAGVVLRLATYFHEPEKAFATISNISSTNFDKNFPAGKNEFFYMSLKSISP
ncbi:hypothetical protein ACFL35_13885 [Candidatus Riflebacteria bacterium]